VHGARSTRALAGQPLELVEQSGVKVLRVVGDDAPASIGGSRLPAVGHDAGAAAKHDSSIAAGGTETRQSARPAEAHPQTPGSPGHAPAPGARLSDAERWLAEFEAGLSPDEHAKFAKMKRGKTLEQTRDMLGGDPHAAHERVRTELAAEREAVVDGLKSKERAADLRQQVAERGLMRDPDVRTILEGVNPTNRIERIRMLRDKLVARILHREIEHRYPDAEVLDGVTILEKLPEASVDAWKRSTRARKRVGSLRGTAFPICSAVKST
jgi:hypothetical protein